MEGAKEKRTNLILPVCLFHKWMSVVFFPNLRHSLSLFLCVAANSGGRGSSSPSPEAAAPEAAAHPLPL